MGEIAEAMLEGLFCQACGELIDGEEPGYPRDCPGCDMSPRTLRSVKRVVGRQREAERHNRERHAAAKANKPFACDQCPKLCRTAGGLAEHKRVKHGATDAV